MEVWFCPEEVAVSLTPRPASALISITNPGDIAPIQSGWGKLLRVEFLDAEYDEGTIHFLEKMWATSSRGMVNKAHALSILEFLDGLDSSISELVIHCGAGRSRSVAVAMFAADRFKAGLAGDLSQHNKTVLRLLQDPCTFDALLPVERKRGKYAGFLRFLGL